MRFAAVAKRCAFFVPPETGAEQWPPNLIPGKQFSTSESQTAVSGLLPGSIRSREKENYGVPNCIRGSRNDRIVCVHYWPVPAEELTF